MVDTGRRAIPWSRWRRRGRGPGGLTLIELVIVLVILLVAIALLMPAMAKVRRRSRSVTCLSNLRQVHQAFFNYLNANGGRPYLYDSAYTSSLWIDLLRPMTTGDIWRCPEASEPSYGWGSAHQAWGPYDARRSRDPELAFLGENVCSYGFNGWFYGTPENGFGARFHFSNPFVDVIPIFGDANWIDGFPRDTDEPPGDLQQGSGPGGPEMGRFCLARHERYTNVVFLDGHAEQVALPQLWSALHWRRRFIPTHVTIPGYGSASGEAEPPRRR